MSWRTRNTVRALSEESLSIWWSCKCLAGGVKHWACSLNICYNFCAFVWEGKETLLQEMCRQLEVLHSDLTAKILFSRVLQTSGGQRLHHSCDPARDRASPWWREKSLQGLEITFSVSTENCSENLGEVGWSKERRNSVCSESVCDVYSAGSWDGDGCQDVTSCLCVTGAGKWLRIPGSYMVKRTNESL